MDDNKKDERYTLQVRTDEQAFADFKDLAQDFTNQDEALKAMLEVYRTQKRKERYPDQKGQIDKLEGSLNSIKSDFLYLIETYNGVKDSIRVEFQEELEELTKSLAIRDDDIKRLTQDKQDQLKTIEDLQADLDSRQAQDDLLVSLKEQVESLKSQLQQSQQGHQQAQKELADLEQKYIGLDEELKGKQSVISELQGDLKAVNVDLNAKQTKINEINAINDDLRQSIKDKDNSLAELIKSLTESNKRNERGNNEG